MANTRVFRKITAKDATPGVFVFADKWGGCDISRVQSSRMSRIAKKLRGQLPKGYSIRASTNESKYALTIFKDATDYGLSRAGARFDVNVKYTNYRRANSDEILYAKLMDIDEGRIWGYEMQPTAKYATKDMIAALNEMTGLELVI